MKKTENNVIIQQRFPNDVLKRKSYLKRINNKWKKAIVTVIRIESVLKNFVCFIKATVGGRLVGGR